MDRELELRAGLRSDAALDRIRTKINLVGPAGKWHAGKARDLLRNPHVLEHYVELLGEHEEAKYLDELPDLVAQTEELDRRCAECWGDGQGPEDERRFLAEREELMRLFGRFQFRSKLYERVARQPEKPILRDAILFLGAAQEDTREATALERLLRMRLREFVKQEQELVDDLRDLDGAREELVAAHEGLALKVAQSQSESDDSTVASAMAGLWRAAAHYDHKRGYRFAEYARHWVREAIDKRRI